MIFKNFKKTIIISIILIVAFVLPIFPVSTLTLAYEVKVEDKSVGFVSTTDDFEKAKEIVENKSVGTVTNEVQALATIVPKTNINSAVEVSSVLTDSLIENKNIVKVYGIYANGICIVASEDKTLLLNALEGYKGIVKTQTGADVVLFEQNVTVTECLSLEEKLTNLDEAIDVLKQKVECNYGFYKTKVVKENFKTVTQTDNHLYKGVTKVKRQGVVGLTEKTILVVFNNGKVVSKEQIKTVVLSETQDEVIVKGTRKRPEVSLKQGDKYLWPLENGASYYISSYYGYRSGRLHKGVDIITNYGTKILAADDGVVTRASWYSSYGYCVDIRHNDGTVTRYAHCSSLDVSAGDTVVMGEVIARVGSTGRSTANHLHFEVWVNGSYTTNPLNYVSE